MEIGRIGSESAAGGFEGPGAVERGKDPGQSGVDPGLREIQVAHVGGEGGSERGGGVGGGEEVGGLGDGEIEQERQGAKERGQVAIEIGAAREERWSRFRHVRVT